MVAAPAASSARRWENRLAAASMRSPRGDRLSTSAARSAPSARAPGRRRAAPRRLVHFARRAAAAPAARSGRRVVRAPSAPRPRPALSAARGRLGERNQRARSRARGSAPGRSSTARIEAGDDGRFESHRRRPAVDDQLDAPAQVGEHVLRGRRRHVSGPVRRRRHQRPAEGGQDVARDRMARHAHGNGIEARGGKLGDRAIRRAWAAPGSAAPARTPPRAARRHGRSARAPAPRPASATWAMSGLNDGRPLAS